VSEETVGTIEVWTITDRDGPLGFEQAGTFGPVELQ
jgi:hypothetical protein